MKSGYRVAVWGTSQRPRWGSHAPGVTRDIHFTGFSRGLRALCLGEVLEQVRDASMQEREPRCSAARCSILGATSSTLLRVRAAPPTPARVGAKTSRAPLEQTPPEGAQRGSRTRPGSHCQVAPKKWTGAASAPRLLAQGRMRPPRPAPA